MFLWKRVFHIENCKSISFLYWKGTEDHIIVPNPGWYVTMFGFLLSVCISFWEQGGISTTCNFGRICKVQALPLTSSQHGRVPAFSWGRGISKKRKWGNLWKPNNAGKWTVSSLCLQCSVQHLGKDWRWQPAKSLYNFWFRCVNSHQEWPLWINYHLGCFPQVSASLDWCVCLCEAELVKQREILACRSIECFPWERTFKCHLVQPLHGVSRDIFK